jgi:RNA polymerase sigma-70 factor (ECF subfamily)
LKRDRHSQFEQLVSPYLQRLYHLAYRYTGQREDAEDLVQELMLKLYPRLDELKTIDKLGPWLTRILYRQFVDSFRRQQRSPVDYTDEEIPASDEHNDEDSGPFHASSIELTREMLSHALDQLKQEQRMLIMLHDVEGYNLQEINDMTDIPIGTLKSRLSRARKKLQSIIQKREPNAELSV